MQFSPLKHMGWEFSVFSRLYSHDYCNGFHTPPKEPLHLEAVAPHFLLPQFLLPHLFSAYLWVILFWTLQLDEMQPQGRLLFSAELYLWFIHNTE